MIEYRDILKYGPFAVKKEDKEQLLTKKLLALSKYHYDRCREYKRIIDSLGCDLETVESYRDIPFLPVGLFKELDLLSISRQDVFKTLTSSGTSGQAVSKIFLDKETAGNQQRTLAKILSDFTGKARMPMLIIDSPAVVKDRKMFSARGAGILGFSIFGTDRLYALNEDMTINIEEVQKFLEKHEDSPIFVFGFTFMIWQHFYKELIKQDRKVDLSQGIMVHGGGWKKLSSEAVSSSQFRQCLFERTEIKRVHDYYGMAEQTGSIYMECEYGHLHASTYSDLLIRDPKDFSLCKKGETGIVQAISMLPESYPGHSILTEDEGVMLGQDDCPCGRMGGYFQIKGRLEHAEIRGCSDTYAATF